MARVIDEFQAVCLPCGILSQSGKWSRCTGTNASNSPEMGQLSMKMKKK